MALSVALAAATLDVERTRDDLLRVQGTATDATDVSVQVNGDEPIQLGAVTQVDLLVDLRPKRNTIALIATDGGSTVKDVTEVLRVVGIRPDDPRNVARLIVRAIRTGGPQGGGT